MSELHEMNVNRIDVAQRYLNLGYRPIPLLRGTKRSAVPWKRFQTVAPTKEEIRNWFHAGEPGIALVTGNGLVVVDVDDPALVSAVMEHCGETPMTCRTPRGGIHAYYRMRQGVHYGNSIRIKDMAIDLRGEGSYVVAPWSRTEKGNYTWLGEVLPVRVLPRLKVSWLRERKPRPVLKAVVPTDNIDVMVRRARAYLSRVEGAISGQKGHYQCIRAAGILVQKFGLSVEQAFPVLAEWSETSCEPPFSEKELLHKLADAYRLRFERGLKLIK